MLQDSPSDSETGVGTNNYNLRDKMLWLLYPVLKTQEERDHSF